MQEIDAPLKGRGGKAPHIRHYAPAEIDQQALPIGIEIQHHLPDTDAEIDILVLFARVYLYDVVMVETRPQRLQHGQAVLTGMAVGQHQYLRIRSRFDKGWQTG